MDEQRPATETAPAPYDIFLCTRELPDALTAETAALRQLCAALAAEGYRVFFASGLPKEMTDEERAAAIVEALRSAKVMVAAGVGEEGADDPVAAKLRETFLSCMQDDPTKQLIACWRDAAPEKLSRDLSGREVLDMSELDFLVTLRQRLAEALPRIEPETERESTDEAAGEAPAEEPAKKPFPWKWVILGAILVAAAVAFFLWKR